MEDKMVRGSIDVGAAVGLGSECSHASRNYHYRIPHETFKATNERAKVDDRIKEILKRFLNTLAQGADNIICPVSGEILQIPVRAPLLKRKQGNESHNCKTFEYKFIRDHLKREGKCPICKEPMGIEDLVVDNEKREEVSKVIRLAIQWLVSKREENVDLDNTTEKLFLENTQEIIGRIRSQSLSEAELYFVSKLVRKSIELYNNKMKYLTQVIADDLIKKMDIIGNAKYSEYHEQLINFSKDLKINIVYQEEEEIQNDPVSEHLSESDRKEEEEPQDIQAGNAQPLYEKSPILFDPARGDFVFREPLTVQLVTKRVEVISWKSVLKGTGKGAISGLILARVIHLLKSSLSIYPKAALIGIVVGTAIGYFNKETKTVMVNPLEEN